MTNDQGSDIGNGTTSHSAGGNEHQRTREYLENAARHVTDRDMEKLNTSVPKKLRQIDMSDLNDGMQWVGSLVERGTTLFEMIRDRGFNLTGKSKTLIAAALIYLVLPLDLTPDFIPGIGLLDDAFVLSTLWKIIQSEVDRYMAYREGRDFQSPL